MDLLCRAHRTHLAAAGALWFAGLLIALALGGCGGKESDHEERRSGPTDEYRVARAIRAFVVGVSEGDGEAACRVLTPQRQAAITARLKQRTCERAIAAQSIATSERDLTRLARSRVTKVDLDGTTGRAEIVTPERRAMREEHIADVVKQRGTWKLASQFFPGRLARGKVPKAPPGPPRNPAEERKVAEVFTRFRRALDRGDGGTACRLRTAAARRAAISQAVDIAGGRVQALERYGGLTCAAVSAGLRVPGGEVERITVAGGRAQLRLEGGATYGLRKLAGRWRVDS